MTWSLIARLWPVVLGLGVIAVIAVSVSRLESEAYDRGVSDERARWEAEQAKRQLAFRDKADTASAKAAERQAQREKVFVPIEKEVIRYVQTPAAAVRCIDDVGVDLMQSAITAANTDIAATPGTGSPAVSATR